MRLGPIGEIEEGPLPDLAAFAVAFAQQDGGGEFRLGADWTGRKSLNTAEINT